MNARTHPDADRPVPLQPPVARPPLARILAVWTVVLVAGFAAVIGLGAPIASPVEELAAAYAPTAPVDEGEARDSAEAIVRLQFPEFAAFDPVVERRDDFGIARWVVVYADPGGAAGVRVSVTEQDGTVEVSAFP